MLCILLVDKFLNENQMSKKGGERGKRKHVTTIQRILNEEEYINSLRILIIRIWYVLFDLEFQIIYA
jgi:hypothetical protein